MTSMRLSKAIHLVTNRCNDVKHSATDQTVKGMIVHHV